MKKQLHLAGFLNAGPVIHSHAVWRHPRTLGHFLEPQQYVTAVCALERGKFDLAFFADRLAISASDDAELTEALTHASQDAARLDPVPLLGLLAGHTRFIGLGATRSTTYDQPLHIARAFSTLDHLTRGRAAWNIVTSMNDSEARNFGQPEHLEHDARYDRADEFLEVTTRLWDSWEAGALVLDRASGFFADARRVHRLDHDGRWFQVAGPLNIPRSPQGRPVLIQAGSSGRGRRFGARWAEVIFTIQPDEARMRAFRAAVRHELASQHRSPDSCKILPAVMPFLGCTTAEAIEHRDQHNALASAEIGLSTISAHLNYDLRQHPAELTLLELEAHPDLPEIVRQKLREFANGGDLTLAELGRRIAASVRVPQLAGTAVELADQLEAWFEAEAGDGFVISPASLPGTFLDFCSHVVPELQRRGLFRRQYDGATLRAHLGLAEPLNTYTERRAAFAA